MASSGKTKIASKSVVVLEPKNVVDKAITFFKDLSDFKNNVTLEEIEHDSESNVWLVTLGYDVVAQTMYGLMPPRKEYKVIRIDDKTGNVLSMKVKNIKL